MKRLILVFIILIAGKIAAAPYITIGDTKFFLAYAPSDSPVGLREYLPTGETLDKWNRLASIRIFKDQKKPEKYLNTMAQNVMKSSPLARAQLFKNNKTKSQVLDFLTYPPIETEPFYGEWNLMRATYIKGKGLVVYQYAMRLYNMNKETPAAIVAERNKMTSPFAAATFEEKEDPKQ